MRSDRLTKICPNTNRPCAGKCDGYGTHSNCPPLIVLAVIAIANDSAGTGR
jgi:predicted metal-binding protein